MSEIVLVTILCTGIVNTHLFKTRPSLTRAADTCSLTHILLLPCHFSSNLYPVNISRRSDLTQAFFLQMLSGLFSCFFKSLIVFAREYFKWVNPGHFNILQVCWTLTEFYFEVYLNYFVSWNFFKLIKFKKWFTYSN